MSNLAVENYYLTVENRRLRKQLEDAKTVVATGVKLMTFEQIGQWTGVRKFLYQGTPDCIPFNDVENYEDK